MVDSAALLVDVDNPDVFAFVRHHPVQHTNQVLVLANFADYATCVDSERLQQCGFSWPQRLTDILGNTPVSCEDDGIEVPARRALWLVAG